MLLADGEEEKDDTTIHEERGEKEEPRKWRIPVIKSLVGRRTAGQPSVNWLLNLIGQSLTLAVPSKFPMCLPPPPSPPPALTPASFFNSLEIGPRVSLLRMHRCVRFYTCVENVIVLRKTSLHTYALHRKDEFVGFISTKSTKIRAHGFELEMFFVEERSSFDLSE